jgi:hypothetical protein
MGDVVTLCLTTRRVIPTTRRVGPATDAPKQAVNLDAVGPVAALMAQISALEAVAAMPPGATTVVIRDGARTLLTSDCANALAVDLMDAKDELLAALGPDARTVLRARREAFRRYLEA